MTMARIRLDLPDNFYFSLVLPIRIYDINYGNHLGNDAVLRMIHEARLQYFRHHGLTELNTDGIGLVISDAAVVYKSQGFYGDILTVEMAVREPNAYGFDVYYKLSSQETGKEVARAKTGIVFFDYGKNKVAGIPEQFRSAFFPDNTGPNK